MYPSQIEPLNVGSKDAPLPGTVVMPTPGFIYGMTPIFVVVWSFTYAWTSRIYS